jgi:hypothetical protein
MSKPLDPWGFRSASCAASRLAGGSWRTSAPKRPRKRSLDLCTSSTPGRHTLIKWRQKATLLPDAAVRSVISGGSRCAVRAVAAARDQRAASLQMLLISDRHAAVAQKRRFIASPPCSGFQRSCGPFVVEDKRGTFHELPLLSPATDVVTTRSTGRARKSDHGSIKALRAARIRYFLAALLQKCVHLLQKCAVTPLPGR